MDILVSIVFTQYVKSRLNAVKSDTYEHSGYLYPRIFYYRWAVNQDIGVLELRQIKHNSRMAVWRLSFTLMTFRITTYFGRL